MGMMMSPSLNSICFGFTRGGSLSMFHAHEQHHQVNHEEQHDGDFQDNHHAVVLIVLEQLVEVVQRLELAVHGAMPVAEMESGGDVFVDAREMPVAEKLGDVGKLV